MSPVWLTHLVASEGGAAAHRRAQALGPEVHAEIVAASDPLAATSSVLAQRCYLHAAAAWELIRLAIARSPSCWAAFPASLTSPAFFRLTWSSP